MNNEKKLKEKISEKDKAKLNYKQKLELIKQHYGVEFDVTSLKDGSINDVKFMNLKYKNEFNNLTIVYNNVLKKFDYLFCEYIDVKTVKNLNHKQVIPNLNKEYKLKLIIAEINRANEEYRKKINAIESKYQATIDTDEKVLQIKKNDEE